MVNVEAFESQTHPNYQSNYYELSNMVEYSSSSSFCRPETAWASLDVTTEKPQNPSAPGILGRKRKTPIKQNHSEIEKRRRDKMNTYIAELSSIVPMCQTISRKQDKLTVLRMAVQHLKTIRGSVNSYTEGHYTPAFLSEQELKQLILQAADGFLYVVGCNRGRILYVSESVSSVLKFSQEDLLGQSLFDILHPKDVSKVKEQFSASYLNPRERFIDAKTMLPVKTEFSADDSRLCPGARRSFFCRMKCKMQVKEEADTSTGCYRKINNQISDKKYCVIQCTGYLKSWTSAKFEYEENESEGDAVNSSCLVAIGRILPKISTVISAPQLKSIDFVSRHAMDGKFLYVDQNATLILRFLPQELVGTSMYEYYHNDDIPTLAEFHKATLQRTEKITTQVYRFRTKDEGFVRIQSEWKAFRNPWTKEIDYVIAKNSLISTDLRSEESVENMPENLHFFAQVASKVGRQIAERIDSQRSESSDCSSANREIESTLPMPSLEPPISPGYPLRGTNQYDEQHVGRNISLINLTESGGSIITLSASESNVVGIPDETVNESPSGNPPADGNDEAAMAVIMSLLEADASLGPVDFSGLPWQMP